MKTVRVGEIGIRQRIEAHIIRYPKTFKNRNDKRQYKSLVAEGFNTKIKVRTVKRDVQLGCSKKVL